MKKIGRVRLWSTSACQSPKTSKCKQGTRFRSS